MKISLTNPLKVLSKHKFTLPQIIIIVVIVGGLAFSGGLMWRNYQKRLANEAASAAAQAEAERLAKLKLESEVTEDEKQEEPKKTDEKPAPKPAAPQPAPQEMASLYLVGAKASKGVNLSWSVTNLTVTQGYKLLLSKQGTPVYGSDHTDGVYIKDSAARGYLWNITNGKTYYFRLCVYNGSGCSHYSNTVTVTAPYVAPTPPSGSLSLSSTGSNNVSWSLSGSAPYGYKLVWTTAPGTPSYPGGGSARYYEKGTVSGEITDSSGTYNVRICAYYEGGCKFYSNQIQVIVP